MFILISVSASNAQTPQYYNYNFTNNLSPFPFNVSQGKKIQYLYRPGDFNQPSPARSGNITSLSLMIGTTLGPATYTNFLIRMGSTTITEFVPVVFYSGPMDTVYFRSSTVLSAPSNQWFTITLDRPFAYDSSKSLVLEIEQCGEIGPSGASTTGTTLTGYRRITSQSGFSCPFSFVGLSDGFVHNAGITLGPVSGISNNLNDIPSTYNLSQNFPNPFNPTTTINFALPVAGFTELKVFDVLGKEAAVLVSEFKQAGIYSVNFDASELSNGVYYYKLTSGSNNETGNFSEIKKMILIK